MSQTEPTCVFAAWHSDLDGGANLFDLENPLGESLCQRVAQPRMFGLPNEVVSLVGVGDVVVEMRRHVTLRSSPKVAGQRIAGA